MSSCKMREMKYPHRHNCPLSLKKQHFVKGGNFPLFPPLRGPIVWQGIGEPGICSGNIRGTA